MNEVAIKKSPWKLGLQFAFLSEMPVLETEKGLIFEVYPILKYLTQIGQNDLCKLLDPFEESQNEKWIHYFLNQLLPKISKNEAKDFSEVKSDLDYMDSILGLNTFISGTFFCLCDFILYVLLTENKFNQYDKYLNIKRWILNLSLPNIDISNLILNEKEEVKVEELNFNEIKRKWDETINLEDKKRVFNEVLIPFISQNKKVSVWILNYTNSSEEGKTLLASGLHISLLLKSIESYKNEVLGIHAILGEEPNLEIRAIYISNKPQIPKFVVENPFFQFYKRRKLDITKNNEKELMQNYFCAEEGLIIDKLKFRDSKCLN